MTVSIGDIVLYTPLPTHRHMMPAWFVKLLDEVDPAGHPEVMVPPVPPCAAIVGGYAAADRYSLLVLVPSQAPMWVDDVAEGTAPGTFRRRWQDVAPTPAPAPAPTPANDANPAAPPAPPPDAAMVGASPLGGTPAPEAS